MAQACTGRRNPLSKGQYTLEQMGTCSKFHGCPDLSLRNSSLGTAQACVWASSFPAPLPPAMVDACAGRRFLSHEHTTPPAPYCGFTSAVALRWLAGVHAATAHCRLVVYTTITGGYDPLKAVPGARAPDECLVALVDEQTAQQQAAAARAHHWLLVVLPDPTPFPASHARSAHTLRASASRLFPTADWTIYTDGKVVLLKSPQQIVGELRNKTTRPLIMIEHPWSLSFAKEFKYAMTRIRYQHARHTSRDVHDLKRQFAFYCREGACNNQPGMVDATMVIQQRAPRRNYPSGRPEPDPRAVIRWLECAWFVEMVLFSHRVQVSYFYVVDLLGLRRHVYMIPRKRWEEKLFTIANHAYKEEKKKRKQSALAAEAAERDSESADGDGDGDDGA